MFKKLTNYKVPRNLLVLFHISALLLLILLAFKKDNINKSTLTLGFILILVIYISNFILLKISSGDHYIFLIVSMLLSIGLLMIYRIEPSLGMRQVIWISGGIIVFFMTYTFVKNIKEWKNWTSIYAIISLLLFLATMCFAKAIKGSRNWLKIGKFSFQPAEIIKILYIFFIASYYSNEDKYNKKGKGSYFILISAYIFMGFLFLQKDLGMALLYYLIFLAIQFVYEKNRRLLYYNIGLSVFGAIIGYVVFDHVKIRVSIWLDPWKDIGNKGYQIAQSLFAIASGGFFGTGIGLGHPDFIPEVHTDFIFSAICEEMGLFTGMAVIMLFLILVYRGFKISLSQEDTFFKIVALGISVMFAAQVFIICGGVIKLIPLTGITLPFVSYGGSSMITSFIALGILQVASEEIETEVE